MNCHKCQSTRVVVESNGEHGSRRVCQDCGESTVVNSTGQRLLTDYRPGSRPLPPRPLTEG